MSQKKVIIVALIVTVGVLYAYNNVAIVQKYLGPKTA